MKLVVVSHKSCWSDTNSPTGFATDGGFPIQMRAISELFDQTVLVVPVRKMPASGGVAPLRGHNLSVKPLSHPKGRQRWLRKLSLIPWSVSNLPRIWQAITWADAVHIPVGSDVGTLGLLIALLRRKPLFVRHCGNWLIQATVAEHFWKWLMERFAGGRNVMLATGGGSQPPSTKNQHIKWIFSTSLTQKQLQQYARRRKRPLSGSVRLIIACRQERLKGTDIVIKSLPLLRHIYPRVHLDVVGDGSALPDFKRLTAAYGVDNHVTFHGKVTHDVVLQLLQQADILSYPTTSSEGFPKVVHEALACGLPVITTHVSVLPFMIGTGCGILLDDVTPESLAMGVQECLADVERYTAMSAQALQTAAKYSLEEWRTTIGNHLQAAWGPLQSNKCMGSMSNETMMPNHENLTN